jgi:uncharacterized Ntn-hydrolase superfamily protein
MDAGLSAEETLARLLADDEQRKQRQVGLVDAKGRTATFTGAECHAWAGGLTGPGYAIQGNILTGSDVVQVMEKTYLKTTGSLVNRLYAALLAGDRAGGDRRGRQSAAIYVVKPKGGYGGYIDRWVDYRVDDHADPVLRLGELLELHSLYFEKSPESERVLLAGDTLAGLQKITTRLGYYSSAANGQMDDATRTALRTFIGNENFEERTDLEAGWMDRPVFDYIMKKFGK